MKLFKSHFFRHNKGQRNGIFFLVLLIIVLQSLFLFVDFTSDQPQAEQFFRSVLLIQKQLDQSKGCLRLRKGMPSIFPFNPNFITDHKGEQLGMSLAEIDRLLAFRKTGAFVNSKRQFQQVTKVSGSLLSAISRYFKFPDWVIERNRLKEKSALPK